MTTSTPTTSPIAPRPRRAFTLIEVLLAVMILGIGLIMITSVFPVGARWTQQNLEESIAGVVARNALAIIQTKYSGSDFPVATFAAGAPLQALPGISPTGKLPTSERAYLFGTASPYPMASASPINPNYIKESLYFWTALIRRAGAVGAPNPNSFDLYIFVFKKGAPEQTFNANFTTTTTITQEMTDPSPPHNPSTRDSLGSASNPVSPKEDFVPYLAEFTYTTTSNTAVPNALISFPTPPPLQPGVTPDSLVGCHVTMSITGGVYRIIRYDAVNQQYQLNAPVPGPYVNGDQMIYAPAADGTSTSPLVYIYHTTISF